METMIRALQTRDLALLKEAVEKEGADVNSKLINSFSPWFFPLMGFVSNKWFDGVSYLIESGADVNAQATDGWSVLQESLVRPNNTKITRFLLEKGADANRVTYKGVNALFIATNDRSIDSLRLICKVITNFEYRYPDGRTALEGAVKCNHRVAASILLDAGAKTSSIVLAKIPKWFRALLVLRKKIKNTLIVFYHLGRKNKCLGKDVTNMIGKMVWETRDRDEWIQSNQNLSSKKNKK
jgi:Ankyrin repeats (3 copies)